jgi:hypothetical protein
VTTDSFLALCSSLEIPSFAPPHSGCHVRALDSFIQRLHQAPNPHNPVSCTQPNHRVVLALRQPPRYPRVAIKVLRVLVLSGHAWIKSTLVRWAPPQSQLLAKPTHGVQIEQRRDLQQSSEFLPGAAVAALRGEKVGHRADVTIEADGAELRDESQPDPNCFSATLVRGAKRSKKAPL